MYLLPVLNIFKKREPNHTLLNAATSVGIDLFVGQKLAKAGWFTRLLVPMVLKGVSSLIMKIKKPKVTEDPVNVLDA